jgi:hypothetical protein
MKEEDTIYYKIGSKLMENQNETTGNKPASVTGYNLPFTLRKDMLNMPGDMWQSVNNAFKDEIFTVTPREFLDRFGLPSGKSAKYNGEERHFFKLIYELHRKL